MASPPPPRPDRFDEQSTEFNIDPPTPLGTSRQESSVADADTETTEGPPSRSRAVAIPGYEILGELGRGGMGVVYKARQAGLNRVVALKMILAGAHAGSAQVRRFLTEAEVIARLKHPHVVEIYEFGEHEGQPYYALEFCEGGALSGKLTGEPMTPRRAAEVAEQLTRALAVAHGMGVVHRDLKPGNVLLTLPDPAMRSRGEGVGNLPFGTPKVTDFGLAKLLDGDRDGPTATGAVLGTPAYMAPEQARGGTKRVGTAADVWALGVILYEMLTGRVPFRGADTMQTMRLVCDQEPVPPRRLQPGVPGDLETITLKCLEKQPSARYPGAGALADDLRAFLDGRPITARPVGAVERAVKWVRRRPLQATAVGLALLALVIAGLGGGAAWRWRAAEEARRQTEAALDELDQEKKKTDAALGRAEQAEQRFRRLSYYRNVDLAHREYLASQVARSNELLADCPEDLRQWEWHYVNRLCNGEALLIDEGGAYAFGVAYSPDGRTVASTGGSLEVRLRDARTGELRRSLKGLRGWGHAVAFSPDGRWVIAGAWGETQEVGEAHVWDLRSESDDPIRGELNFPGAVRGVSISADGETVALAGGELRLWAFRTDEPARRVAPEGTQAVVMDAAFLPDGRSVAVAVAAAGPFPQGAVEVWRADTGETVRRVHSAPGQTFRALGLSRDGKLLAAGTMSGEVWCWAVPEDLAGGDWKPNLAVRGHQLDVLDFAFAPDGRTLASGSMDQTAKLWDVTEHPAPQPGATPTAPPTDSRELLTIRGHTEDVFGLAFSPDGDRLATAGDQTVKLWDVPWTKRPDPSGPRRGPPAGQQAVALGGFPSQIIPVAFSPDSTLFAYATDPADDGPRARFEVSLVDPVTGRERVRLTGMPTQVMGLGFDPEGRLFTANLDALRVWSPDRAEGGVLEEADETVPFAGWGPVPTNACSLAVRPDGKQVAIGTFAGVVWVWDLTEGELRHTLQKPGQMPVFGVAYDPSGTLLATTDGLRARVWDASTGQPRCVLEGHTRTVSGVCFSPDGATVATCSFDNTSRFWDPRTGEQLDQLHGHNHYLQGIAFRPDGGRLADACHDMTVKVWDQAEKQDVLTLRGHPDKVASVTFSPDGHFLASASHDGTVLLWDARAFDGRSRPAKERFPAVSRNE